MKKLFYYVLAITVAAIAAVSCNKGEEDHIVKEETSFCYTFTIADDITKATLDGQGVQWVSGDKVGMYIVESDGVTEVYTGYANVDVNNSPKAIKLYSKKAIPAGAIAYTYFPQHSNENKTATVIRFDAEQQGGGKSVMPMVGLPFTVKTEVPLTGSGNNAKAETNGVIHFLNLGAIIDFKVFGENFATETIKSIKFKATGKKINNVAVNPITVCGHATLDVTQINLQNSSCLDLAFNDAEHVSDSAVVMQQVPVAAGSDDATSIYMVVAPGSYSGAITIETDAAYYTFPFDYTKGISLSRNTVKHISIDLANCTSRVEKPQSFTWDLSIDQTVSASTTELAWNYRGVTMVAAKANATTNTNNYYPGTTGKTYTSTRFYTGSTLTITPYTGSSIVYVEFLATQNSYATALKDSEWTNATTSAVSNNEKLIKVTPTNGANAFYATIGATCGFTSVTVYYTGELGEEQGGPVEANIYFDPDSKEVSWDEIDNFEKPAMVKPEDFDGTFTWSSSNEDVATVDDNGDITFVGNGTTTITASYSLTAKYLSGSASYGLTVSGKPAEKGESGDNPYSVAEALAIINALDDNTSTGEVYTSGIICEVVGFKDDNSITYNISADGTKSNFIQVYHGKGLNGADFNSIYDLGVGDAVVVKGIMKKFTTANAVTPEFDEGSELYSIDRVPFCVATLSSDEITYTGGNSIALNIYANVAWTATISGSASLKIGDEAAAAAVSGNTNTEITVIIPENQAGATYSISFTATGVTAPAALTITQHAKGEEPKGSEENPYTPSEAYEAATTTAVPNVYVKGIVSAITTPFSSQHGNVTYTLSDDGTTNGNQFTVYRGTADDANTVAVGDGMIVKGSLINYIKNNVSTPEFEAGAVIQSKLRMPAFTSGEIGFTTSTTVTLSAETGATIYYTTDGTDPTTESGVYSTSLDIMETTTVKAIAVKDGLVTGIASKTFTKAISNPVTFTQPTQNGCSFTVSVGGENITSGTMVPQNTVVTLTATAGTGYSFSGWTVTGATVSGNTATATFTMGTSAVSISATFTELAIYTFTKYSGAITEGDYLIVYSDKAMNTTVSNNRLQYVEVTPSNNVITTTSTNIVWHIKASGDYWTIYNEEAGKYAAGNGTKNQAALYTDGTDTGSLWTVTGSETYEFVNKKNSDANVNCNLRNNGTYGFACYSTSTGGALTLYKKN